MRTNNMLVSAAVAMCLAAWSASVWAQDQATSSEENKTKAPTAPAQTSQPTDTAAQSPQALPNQDAASSVTAPHTTSETARPPGTPAAGELQGVVDPKTYVPRTEHDNTPWRFNMQQDGKSMSAEEFDRWMKQRGVRVATGKPAIPKNQNCPTPEGDKGDSDGDGLINCLDQCPDSQAGQTIGPDGCPVPVSIDLEGVTFAYDKSTISPEAKKILDEAVAILKEHDSLKVEVAGHTDSRGDSKYNQALSERRAKAVYDYVVKAGIDKARLIGPIGYGETRPLAPNQKPDGSDDPDGRAKNRRTELNIQN